MKNFYLTRLARLAPDMRQGYLDETVVARYRDEVREAWNEDHPDETLD